MHRRTGQKRCLEVIRASVLNVLVHTSVGLVIFCMFFTWCCRSCQLKCRKKQHQIAVCWGKAKNWFLECLGHVLNRQVQSQQTLHVAGIALKVAPCCNLLKKGKEKTILCEMFAFLCLFYHRWIDGHIMIYHGYIRLYHILHSVFAKCYVCFINSFLWCISKCVGQLLSGFSRSVELCTR